MITKVAFQRLRRMSELSLLVAIQVTMLFSCRADAQQNIKPINMEKGNLKEIYLAGGCFWGTEHYFTQIYGVVDTEVGFANGRTENPTYKEVCTDKTGFAETVHVTYDPAKVSLKFLLEMYFKAIDPTSINQQGHDTGTQYRTGVYYTDKDDEKIINEVFAEEQKHINGKTSLYGTSSRQKITTRIISTRIPTATAICRKACSSLRARQRTPRSDTQ